MDNLETLRKCQLLQLETANEIKRICQKHEIPYSLIAGTLLGAVRHKGFIPWDDDLDVGMLRADYDRFLQVAPTELGDKYFLQTWDTDPRFGLPIAKVRLNNTEYVEKNSQNVPIHSGIYVDVFPFDNLADDLKKRKKQKTMCRYYFHLLLNKAGYDYVEKSNKKKYMIAKLFGFLSFFTSYEKLHKQYLKWMTKYNGVQTDKIITFGGASSPEKETLSAEWMQKLQQLSFEDTEFSAFAQWDAYLTHFYGDYMTPPPEDKRYLGHGIVKVDFGPYKA